MIYALTASLAAHLFFLIAHMALLRRAQAAEVQRNWYRDQYHRISRATRIYNVILTESESRRYLKTRSN